MLAFKKPVHATVIPGDLGKIQGRAYQNPAGTAAVVAIEFDRKTNPNPTVRDAIVQFLDKAGLTGTVRPEALNVVRHGANNVRVGGSEALANGDVLSTVSIRRGGADVDLDAPFHHGDTLGVVGESYGG